MPIENCKLPSGDQGFRWGKHGKCYKDRADAERQAAAIYASGYRGKDEELVVKTDGKINWKAILKC